MSPNKDTSSSLSATRSKPNAACGSAQTDCWPQAN